jgi:organic radical activating enzyme
MSILLDKSIGRNFCYAPWTNIHINPQGVYKSCCAGQTEMGDLRIIPIQSVVSSAELQEIKQAILNNEKHSNCEICIRQEQNTSSSERSWYNDIAENQPITINNINDQHLQNLDIRWSTTCNLSCVYCDQYASSQWASLKKQPVPKIDYTDTMAGILKFIDANRRTLKNLALLGGEPLLQKENDQLLDVIDAGVYINVITNLSVPLENNRIFKKLLEKNRVMWDVSFETVEDRFNYVRHGSNWDLIIKNLQYLQDATKDKPDHLIGITSQYSVYNALNLVELHEYFKDNNIPIMRWNELNYPEILAVISLPKQYLDRAIIELEGSVKFHMHEPQQRFLLDMADALRTVQPTVNNCDGLYRWHAKQEQAYWPDSPLKFANLWPEYKE